MQSCINECYDTTYVLSVVNMILYYYIQLYPIVQKYRAPAPTYKKTDKQTDRQIDRQTDRQTDRRITIIDIDKVISDTLTS